MKNPTNTGNALAGHSTQNSKANSIRTTVKSAVLSYLKSGRKLTSNEALLMFGTSRLGAVIHDLRKQGYAIHTDFSEVEAAKGKPTYHKAHVAVYSMVGRGSHV
jgi:hypothetical protein